HLNLPFRDPLVGEPGPLPESRTSGAPWTVQPSAVGSAAAAVDVPSGRTVVIGAAAADGAFPVIADARSGLEGPSVIAHADAILRHVPFTPEVIVRVGPPPASRVVNEWAAASGAREIVVGG